ncbi:hypothetical protein CDAR_227121 [Caerostris darwini]|uniref:Uncharacterized protein n=1 Tax=Caerostris darwini TaxID=1538125 RepID=A0AAV4PDV0_9ARAC|nr:hypothetical protein CDAR_227121 [Caerostris darwini]
MGYRLNPSSGLQTIIDALKGNWKSNTNPHSAIEFRAFPENRALWESGEMFVICENQHLMAEETTHTLPSICFSTTTAADIYFVSGVKASWLMDGWKRFCEDYTLYIEYLHDRYLWASGNAHQRQ